MGTPGTGPAGSVRGPLPGAPLSVEEALDGDLDAYLDRELFVHSSQAAAPRVQESTEAASGSMRALLDLADEESQWLETLPPPALDVTSPPEPEEPPVEIPEWMRTSPGAKVTTPFAAMLAPVDPITAHPEAAHAGTDGASQPMTPWSAQVAAQQGAAPAYPGTLLPGIAPPPPGAAMPAWTPHPQQWAMPMPVPVEPRRIAGMKPGALFGAAAVGALTAGLLVVAGLHFREHALGARDISGAGTSSAQASGMAGATQTVLPSGSTGMQPASSTQMGFAAGQPGASLSSSSVATLPTSSAQAGLIAGLPGAGAQGAQPASSAQTGLISGQPGAAQASVPNTEATGAQQAAASVSGTVLSTAQSDMQGAANNLRASQPAPSSTVGGTSLTSGETETVALQMPSARKQAAKTVVASRPAEDTEAEAEAAPSELTFHDSETSAADEESTPAEDTESEEQQSELDEEFARELGFTDDAKPAAAKAPERTVYIPPAPDAKESLTPDDVKAVVVANQPAITACVREHAQGTAVEKGGRFMVRWSVLPSGDTTNVSMDTDALKATPLAHCIEDVVRRWKFPAHQVRMEAPIRFPFVF